MTGTAIFHLGAHKTATSFLQETIQLNLGLLQSHGIHYVQTGREDIRFHVARGRAFRTPDSLDRIAAAAEGARICLYSDEDIWGRAGITDPRAIYSDIPDKVARLRMVTDRFPGAVVVLTIRDQADFLPSVYQQEVKRDRFGGTFGAYLARKVDTAQISWLPLVTALAGAYGDRLRVFDFAAFRAAPQVMWQTLGIDADLLADMQRIGQTNSSLSAPGLAVMRLLYRKLDKATHQALERLIAAQLPVRPGIPAESYWEPEAEQRLRARFRADCADLRGILAAAGASFAELQPAG